MFMTKMIGKLEIPHLNFNHQAASSALTSETGDVLTMKCAATLEDFLCSSDKPSAYDCSEVADIPDKMEWIFTDKYSKIIKLGYCSTSQNKCFYSTCSSTDAKLCNT